MTHIQPGRAKRGAFTLVELLVVILILVILVSLTAASVMKFFYEGPKTKVASELHQFDVAFQQLFIEYDKVNYVPSYLVLREDNNYNLSNPAELASVNFLKRMFGKNLSLSPATPIDWNGNGVPDVGKRFVLEGKHCLVFFLGGIPSPPGAPNGCLGFSTNPLNPATIGGTRRGPFYTQFDPSRLVRDANGFFYYADAWTPKIGQPPQPYAFFSAYGVAGGYKNSWGLLDQANLGAPLLGDNPSLLYSPAPPAALAPYTGPGGWANNNTWQIISAGKDNLFGTGGAWRTAAAPYWEWNKDNQTNFSRGVLDAEP